MSRNIYKGSQGGDVSAMGRGDRVVEGAALAISCDMAPCRMTGRKAKNMYYVYFLLEKNGQVYTGSTKDLKERVAKHNAGSVLSTKNRRPLTLIGYESYKLQSDALRRERYLKTTEGKRLFRQQYRDVLNSLHTER